VRVGFVQVYTEGKSFPELILAVPTRKQFIGWIQYSIETEEMHAHGSIDHGSVVLCLRKREREWDPKVEVRSGMRTCHVPITPEAALAICGLSNNSEEPPLNSPHH
jgi:hypothetical protein